MAEDIPDGSVTRATLVDVLEKFQSYYGFTLRVEGTLITLAKGETIFCKDVPEIVGRRFVAEIANKLDIQVHFFYHPEMIQQGTKNSH